MKIFSAQQLSQADKETIKRQGISSLALMERAASLAFVEILNHYKEETFPFYIFCGVGNNGGDGLVIARKLLEYGYEVKVFILAYTENYSKDFETNLRRLQNKYSSSLQFIKTHTNLPSLPTDAVIIDAIFGYGLNRPLPVWVAKLVCTINRQSNPIFSIDLPSGMYADRVGEQAEVMVRADYCLTFQSPKVTFFLPQTGMATGIVKVLDIGLDQKFLDSLNASFETIDLRMVSSLRQKRAKFSHKGTYGHCLLVGGSYGMMGSMVLATRAALRAGAGKVSSMIPKTGNYILQTAVPEAMILTVDNDKHLASFVAPTINPKVICFGMGAGTREDTASFMLEVMKFTKTPMLIDADGLNLLAKFPSWLAFLPEKSVLTPHPKELEGLIGKWKDDVEKIEKTQKLALKYDLVILIKGAHTMVVTPLKTYINLTGNPGMATAGSGDVLAGLIGGLMAQGYTTSAAAIMGVWLHGRAGDIAVKKSSSEALIAGDLIPNFGKAFQELEIKIK